MNSISKAVGIACAAMYLSGCSAIGLEALEDLRELEEAKYALPKPVVQPTVRLAPQPPEGIEGRVFEVNDRLWQATATEYALPTSFVRPVGTVEGVQLNAFAWDQPPYDRLLASTPHGFYLELSDIY